MTKLELSIKLEKDFQKRIQEKLEMWEYLKALDEQEEASKIIDDSDQIRVLYNRNIEPFNIAEDKNDQWKIQWSNDATPEEIKLVKNIIKQIKTNEKTKGFTWNYDNW